MTKYLILSSFLVFSFLITENVNAAEKGDLITCPGTESVYYVGDHETRWIFPDQQTYYSWYEDTSSVTTIPCEDIGSYPIGGSITIQPGLYLIKNQSSPKIYAIEPGGELRWIQTPEQAVWLYGNSWEGRIKTISDAEWPHYNLGDKLDFGETPEGTIIFELNRPPEDQSEFYYYKDRAYNITEKIDEVLNNKPSKVLEVDQENTLQIPENFWMQIKDLTWKR